MRSHRQKRIDMNRIPETIIFYTYICFKIMQEKKLLQFIKFENVGGVLDISIKRNNGSVMN